MAPTKFHKIGIIGCGISGIAAAKQLSEHEPVVFEATDSIGGVWRHCSYASTKLQTPRRDFEFSDFPWTQRDYATFPSYQEILDYLHSYATYFDFNSKVVELRYIGESENSGEYGNLFLGHPVWEVGVKTSQSENIQYYFFVHDMTKWYAFEFLVICTGKYGDVPAIPKFPENKGPEVFEGKVLHTIDYCKLNQDESTQLLKDKKVVIFGYKKSAIDLAVECAEANQGGEGQACTMVVRTLHWTVPHYSIWGLPFYLFYSTRASQFIYDRPNQSLIRSLLCHILSPMRRVVSKLIESYLTWKLPLDKYGLRPEHPFLEDYASCQMAILPENFFSEADKGKIVIKRCASKWWFWERGVELEDGERLDADVVVLATGFDGKDKLKAIFPDSFRALLDFTSGMMPLYRGTINPLIPNTAFVGYIESVSNLQTAEIRCKWLSRLLAGHFKLPSMERMLWHITEEMEIMKKATRFFKRSCISTFSINHTDQICEEMGWNSWRKPNWLAEAFSPYTSQDYRQHKK
ncbi:flavin-containing monooxygenase family protein [Striga asiatica]|uniref:Flavin-containing monooxygenase n=1 Tax=Striga asiatica TaxID=4170 RepID=A0A5A7Q5B9_STRAF|nr:flavin-containing monooxygenase family protein [Striga asiatica]